MHFFYIYNWRLYIQVLIRDISNIFLLHFIIYYYFLTLVSILTKTKFFKYFNRIEFASLMF